MRLDSGHGFLGAISSNRPFSVDDDLIDALKIDVTSRSINGIYSQYSVHWSRSTNRISIANGIHVTGLRSIHKAA